MRLGFAFAAFLVAFVIGGCSPQAEGSYASESKAATSSPMNNAASAPAGAVMKPEIAPRGPGGAPGSTGTSLVAQKRQVILDGSISVRVKDVNQSAKDVIAYVGKVGGYVEQRASTNLSEGNPQVILTIRVPYDTFDASLEKIASLGVKLSDSSTGQDVTDQLVDLSARIKTLKAQEETFREILKSTRKIEDVMNVHERLLSKISVTLVQSEAGKVKEKDPNWLAEAWGGASGAFGSVGKALLTTVVWLLVFAPFWLIPVLGIWWLVRRSAKKPPVMPQ